MVLNRRRHGADSAVNASVVQRRRQLQQRTTILRRVELEAEGAELACPLVLIQTVRAHHDLPVLAVHIDMLRVPVQQRLFPRRHAAAEARCKLGSRQPYKVSTAR